MADPMEEEEVTDDEYRAALEALQSTISGKTRAAPKGPNDLTWEQQFDRLHLYLERLGMTESVNAMSYIHVAGTKGKGSTCAFVDACLRRAGTRTGLYTSPHLVDIRERYRIDGRPVSKTTFTRNFWWLHAKLRETCEADLGMPAYFRFLTLLGFRIFTERAVDAVVLEVGLGGRLDATNVIRRPAVCGVTSLGLDHVEVLGDTVGKIAREKAGIFKPHCPAITSPQVPEAMQALELRAAEVDGCSLTTARPLREWRTPSGDPIRLGLAGKHQELNAALAIELMRTWTRRTSPVWGADALRCLDAGTLPETWATGLAETEWFGRAQVVPDDVEDLSWYLDGAHTEESMRHVAEWFCGRADGDETDGGGGGGTAGGGLDGEKSTAEPPVVRLLLFNCMEERDPTTLLTPLAQTAEAYGAPITAPALFAPAESSSKGLTPFAGAQDCAWQTKLARTWDDLARKHAGCVRRGGSEGLAGRLGGEAVARAEGARVGAQLAGASVNTSPPSTASAVVPRLRQAVEQIRRRAREERALGSGRRVHVLVTGSLYLVGDMLRILGRAG